MVFRAVSRAMTSKEQLQTKIIDWKWGDAPLSCGALACAIGNFDGVHKGHQMIISEAVKTAKAEAIGACVVTFLPHPRQYFRRDDAPFLLMDESDKTSRIASLGVDYIIRVAFNPALQQMTAQQFVEDVLVAHLGIRFLFAGSDFAFGNAREGNIASLQSEQLKTKISATAVTLVTDDNMMVVSSSRIRAALQAGQVGLAAEMLGAPHQISGIAAQGDQRGRLLDFPTANLEMKHYLHPAFGVYAITAWLPDNPEMGVMRGVCNIGQRPTVNNRGVLAEAHLFDFQGDIYGQRLSIALIDYIRAEQKFPSLEALKHQIESDCHTAKQIFEKIDANSFAS